MYYFYFFNVNAQISKYLNMQLVNEQSIQHQVLVNVKKNSVHGCLVEVKRLL